MKKGVDTVNRTRGLGIDQDLDLGDVTTSMKGYIMSPTSTVLGRLEVGAGHLNIGAGHLDIRTGHLDLMVV